MTNDDKATATSKSEMAQEVARRRPLLLRQALRMLHEQAGAEDAVQDAMVAALCHVDDFRGEARIGTWLYRVGANAVLMGLRRERRAQERKRRAQLALPMTGWLNGSYQAGSPGSEIEAREQAGLLKWAVEQLPEHYRSVVMLCDLDERPLDEVASALGLSVGGVRTRRLRAHRMLRHTLLSRAEQ